MPEPIRHPAAPPYMPEGVRRFLGLPVPEPQNRRRNETQTIHPDLAQAEAKAETAAARYLSARRAAAQQKRRLRGQAPTRFLGVLGYPR